MNDLEKRIEKIENRNKKVEEEKEWETSSVRKISIMILTYIVIVILMYVLEFKNIFIGALIPVFGYFLSTLSLGILKKSYLGKRE